MAYIERDHRLYCNRRGIHVWTYDKIHNEIDPAPPQHPTVVDKCDKSCYRGKHDGWQLIRSLPPNGFAKELIEKFRKTGKRHNYIFIDDWDEEEEEEPDPSVRAFGRRGVQLKSFFSASFTHRGLSKWLTIYHLEYRKNKLHIFHSYDEEYSADGNFYSSGPCDGSCERDTYPKVEMEFRQPEEGDRREFTYRYTWQYEEDLGRYMKKQLGFAKSTKAINERIRKSHKPGIEPFTNLMRMVIDSLRLKKQ